MFCQKIQGKLDGLCSDGFAVAAAERSPGQRTELSVRVESEGRAARVREVMARWAPGATLLGRG